jgi:acyl carrier protein
MHTEQTTEQTTVYDTVAGILRDVAKVPTELIAPDKRIEEDLDIDSLAMVEVAVAAESRFGISVPDERAAEFVIVAHLVEYIEAALAADHG